MSDVTINMFLNLIETSSTLSLKVNCLLSSGFKSRVSVQCQCRLARKSRTPGAKIVAVEELFVSIFDLFIIISNIDIR